jgi:hypothetical protein
MLCEAQDYVKLSLVIPLVSFIFCTYSVIGSDPLIVDKYLSGHQFPERPDMV